MYLQAGTTGGSTYTNSQEMFQNSDLDVSCQGAASLGVCWERLPQCRHLCLWPAQNTYWVCLRKGRPDSVKALLESLLAAEAAGDRAGTRLHFCSESCNTEGLSGESLPLLFSVALVLSSSIIPLFFLSSYFSSV